MTKPKYVQVAERIQAQIADGLLMPGESAPSGAALARATGYSTLTCRKALNRLIKAGVLIAGPSPGARPRVPSPAATAGEQTLADAGRTLSASLAAWRRTAGLTQPQLAARTGMSVTSIGHAETGRLWQSRRFWELVDKGVGAGGALLTLHDAYRAAAVTADPTASDAVAPLADVPPTVEIAASAPVACVTITWANGTVTTVYPSSPDPAASSDGP